MDNSPDLNKKKWVTLDEAAAIFGLTDRQAHGLLTRNSIITWRDEKKWHWSGRQVRALASRLQDKVSVPAAAPAAKRSSPVDGCCGVCGSDDAHFTGQRKGEQVALCFRCFNDASYTAVRHGQTVQVVTA